MKRKSTSKPSFSAKQRAAALAAAAETPVEDRENPRTRSSDWDKAIASRSLPELQQKLGTRRRGPGKKPAKVLTTLRLPVDTLERWKATGPGWQTRMADALSRVPHR